MPQPPLSPDLAPANCFLFPKLKTSMKYERFATIEEMKERYQKTRFSSVSKIGKNAGISILYLNRVTLNGTRKLLMN